MNEAGSSAMPSERSLLIVEDDKSFLQRLARAMEGRGFTVTTAESVSDGLLQVEKAAPAFAVVDMRLGDGNGLDVISAMKKRRPEARAIILTGYGNIATAVNAVKLGAVDYLAKPVDADDVAAALLALDNKKIDPPENPMSADRVRWEHIQRIYELCGRNVSETARRLNMHRRTLQRILAKRAPKYISFDQLLDRLTYRARACALELAVVRSLRVGNSLQPKRCRMRKAQGHRSAGRRRNTLLRRFANDRGAEGVGDDQAGPGGEDIARHPGMGGEEQPIAMAAIIHPFLVGAKIRHRGFYLDNDDFAVAAKRDQIGAPARRQRQFADHAIAECVQIARGAAGDRQCRFRLPAIDQRRVGRCEACGHGGCGVGRSGHTENSRKLYVRERTMSELTHATDSTLTRLTYRFIVPRRRVPEKPSPTLGARQRSRRVR